MNDEEDSEKNCPPCWAFFSESDGSVREEGSYGRNTSDSLVCGVLVIARYKLYIFNFYHFLNFYLIFISGSAL